MQTDERQASATLVLDGHGIELSLKLSADGTPTLWIDTGGEATGGEGPGIGEDSKGPRLRIYLNDESVHANPARPLDSYEACPRCGCTDIEATAWVHANTGVVSNSEPPSDETWCPQCELWGRDATTSRTRTVKEPQPFDADRPDPGER